MECASLVSANKNMLADTVETADTADTENLGVFRQSDVLRIGIAVERCDLRQVAFRVSSDVSRRKLPAGEVQKTKAN